MIIKHFGQQTGEVRLAVTSLSLMASNTVEAACVGFFIITSSANVSALHIYTATVALHEVNDLLPNQLVSIFDGLGNCIRRCATRVQHHILNTGGRTGGRSSGISVICTIHVISGVIIAILQGIRVRNL